MTSKMGLLRNAPDVQFIAMHRLSWRQSFCYVDDASEGDFFIKTSYLSIPNISVMIAIRTNNPSRACSKYFAVG